MAKFFGMFQTQTDDEPLASAKSVSAWAEKRPPNDPMGLVMGMTQLLEEQSTRRPEASPGRVQALLALDRLSLVPLAQLQQQYRLSSLSDDVRQQLWHARNNLARWFAYAYEQTYENIRNQTDRAKYQGLLQGLFARMFYYRGVQAKQSLFRYEQWIPAKWKFLHAAFKEALDLGVSNVAFSLSPGAPPNEQSSPEQEYIHFLLMQRINTGNLSVTQIDQSASWLREWAAALHLVTTPLEGDLFWVLDLSQAEGLLTPGDKKATGSPLLYLDVAPLRDRLTELKNQLNEQIAQGASKPETREQKDKLALAKRLESLWLPHAKQQQRRGERRPEQRPVLIAAGWTDIAIFMREARPWKPHDPYHYTYDDATELLARGRTSTKTEKKADTATNLHPDRAGWRIHDISDTGCRVVSATKQAAQIQLGVLVGLLREDDTRWRVAVVRRLKRRTADHTELGLEMLADSSMLVTPEPVVIRDAGYSVNGIDVSSKGKRFDALFIPPQQKPGATPVYSLVLPVTEFATGKVLSLAMDGENRLVRLAVPIEYDKDWVWSTFEVVHPQGA
jgi:hypothetical protein